MSRRKGLYIPNELARMLAAEPEDVKDKADYKEMQKLARTMVRLLIENNK